MSREVLGSAGDDVVPEPRAGTPARPRGAVRLDGEPALPAAGTREDDGATTRSPTAPGPTARPATTRHPTTRHPTTKDTPAAAARAPVAGSSATWSSGTLSARTPRAALPAAMSWTEGRLDVLRGSRRRTAAALAVVAVVSGLVAVGVTEQVRQARLDAAAGVVAWLDYSSSAPGGIGGAGQAVLRLNVVNTGSDTVTVTAADLEGGLDGGARSGVVLDLGDELSVPPSGYASGTVAAAVEDCGNAPVARGGSRDGDLQVTVTGPDLRAEVLPGTRVGDFPVSSSTVVELGCGGELTPTVVVQGATVRADGRFHITLRGAGEDVEVGLTAPDGVELVTDPPVPVLVPGGEDAPMTTIAVALEVTTCTVSAQQLDAGNQVQLVVDGQRSQADLDQVLLNSWVVREVARDCA